MPDIGRWIVRGFQGAMQALEEWCGEGNWLDDVTYTNLQHWNERLSKLLEQQKVPTGGPPARRPGPQRAVRPGRKQ